MNRSDFITFKKHIAQYGLSISCGCPVHDDNPVVHTVGLTAQGLPEMILIGLKSTQMIGQFMNVFYTEVLKGVKPASPRLETDYFNFPLAMVDAVTEQAKKFAPNAFAFARSTGLPEPRFLQWVWSDDKGLFPWQSGFNATMIHRQPILCPNPAEQLSLRLAKSDVDPGLAM